MAFLLKIGKIILGLSLLYLIIGSMNTLALLGLQGGNQSKGELVSLYIYFFCISEWIFIVSTYGLMKLIHKKNLQILFLRTLLVIMILMGLFVLFTNDFSKIDMNQFLFGGNPFGGVIHDPKVLQDPDLYRIAGTTYPGYGSVLIYLLNIVIIGYYAIRGIRK